MGPPPKVVPMSSILSRSATRLRQQQRGHRKAVAQRLRRRDDVGRDAVEIGAERRAGAPHAALDLIEDQHGAHLVAAPAQRLQHRLADVERAADALHGLDDDRRRVAIDGPLDRGGIVARREADIEGPCAESRTISRARPRSARRPPPCGRANSARARRRCPRPVVLNASFSAFSFASAPLLIQNTVSSPSAANLDEARGGAFADRHRQRVGLKRHLARLPLERGEPARVAVAQARNRVAAVKIEHLAAVARMKPDAFAMHDFDRILREHARQMSGVGALNGVGDGTHRSTSGPARRGRREAGSFFEAQQSVHPLQPPPAAPLFRLSSTAMTAIVRPFVTALRFA